MTLPEKLVALHDALASAEIPHAFGGAIALAYWTLDPRGTTDIDLNIFAPSVECDRALSVLPAGVAQTAGTRKAIVKDGQVRLWWGETPVDLFFDYVPIHADAARNAQVVPFAGRAIPILGPVELAVFKAMFDRTKDWADIEGMLVAGRVSPAAIGARLRLMLDGDDHRLARLREAERRAAAESDRM